MPVDSRNVRGWAAVTVGLLAVAVFSLADALGFGSRGFGRVQSLGVLWGLLVMGFGGWLVHRRGTAPGSGLPRVNRVLIGALVGLTLTLSSVVLWGWWERFGELSADQIAWCGDRGPEMYEAAVELDLVTIDEVVDLILNLPSIDPGFAPQPTREGLLRLFETEPAEMQRIAAAVWWRGGVDPDSEVYKDACEEAYATAASEGFPPIPGDTVNCGDFDTSAEAQAWYDTHVRRYGDIARLDRVGDRVPCEDAGWHIDLAFESAPDNVIYGVEWGPDTWFSDMRNGDSCASGMSWAPPEPDFPFDDIRVAIYSNPTDMMRFTFPTQLSPRGAWVHLADGTCLAVDEEGSTSESHYYQFDDALPEFDRT